MESGTSLLGPVLPNLRLDLTIACDGSATLTPSRDAGSLPPYVQAPLASSRDPESHLKALRQVLLPDLLVTWGRHAYCMYHARTHVCLPAHVHGLQLHGAHLDCTTH